MAVVFCILFLTQALIFYVYHSPCPKTKPTDTICITKSLSNYEIIFSALLSMFFHELLQHLEPDRESE